jgi:TolA-binding protein
LLLRKLSADDWKNVPQGQDRFAEIVLLFQKKVPLNLLPARLDQLEVSESSSYLQTEIQFAKGRAAFERQDFSEAQRYLDAIPKGSRYFGQAHYLLGALLITQKKYKEANAEFSKIFENSVLVQSSELWSDMSSQMTAHWGANLHVQLNIDTLSEAENVAELSLLALARSSYATKDYLAALGYYDRIGEKSRLRPRALFEKTWTLLALNRHDEAQKTAAALAVTAGSFESYASRPLRALILTDAGQTDEARQEIQAFQKEYADAKKAIVRYRQVGSLDALPEFLRNDLASDRRLQGLKEYEKSLETELASLKHEDRSLFPVYSRLENEISPLIGDAQRQESKFIEGTIQRRVADLDRLNYQARLIEIETYLEDREKLRQEFKTLGSVDEAKQNEHDQRLIALLENAVNKTDQLIADTGQASPALLFRQSELLWELSRTIAMFDQATGKKDSSGKANALQKRALELEEKVIAAGPSFAEHADALFFNGYAKIELGQIEAGSRIIREYIQQYPKHAHVPDAYRILADLAFDQNRFKEAEEGFKRILEFPDSPVVGYALYKIGWCAYNEKSFARALLAFEKAVLWSAGGSQGDESRSLNLKRESKHDLISVYAEVGDYRKASEYFRRFYDGDERAGSKSWLYELAKVLDKMGQFEKSSAIYRTLAALNADANDGIIFQTSIIQGSFKLHHWDDVLLGIQNLTETYSSELAKPAQAPAPAAFAEDTIHKIVLARLLETKDEDTPQQFETTKKINKLYLQAFDAWPSSQEPLYRYAQFLLRIKDIDGAVAAFDTHWSKFKTTLAEPIREEALRNLIYTLDQKESKNTDLNTAQGPKIMQLCDEYAKAYPKTKYTRPIAYLQSSVLFKYHRIDDGIAASQAIFDASPSDEIGRRSFKNLRTAYYDKKDWAKAFQWASALFAKKDRSLAPYRPELKTIREETLFLLAENTTDHRKAADIYMQLANDPDTGDLRVKSLYNAFVQYQKADLKVQALAAADQAQKIDPDFENLKQISGVRSALLQEAGDYERALPLLQGFLKDHDASVAPEVLQTARLNAGLITEALGQDELAEKYFHEYLRPASGRSPASDEANRALERIAHKLHPQKPQATPAEWLKLSKRKAIFLKSPISKYGDLATKIKKAGEKLEALVKDFSTFAGAKSTPTDAALEAFCTLPELYDGFGKSVMSLSKVKGKEDPDLAVELKKVVDPLDQKAAELASECLSKSNEAFHVGKQFEWVNAKWGWKANERLQGLAQKVFADLASKAPYFDPAQENESEAQIIQDHLQNKSSAESWYALAVSRMNRKKLSMARLTLVDALVKYPKTGSLLNGLAAVEEAEGNLSPADLARLYETAAKQGSKSAYLNQAVINYKAGRFLASAENLKDALSAGALPHASDLVALLSEALSKPEGGTKK